VSNIQPIANDQPQSLFCRWSVNFPLRRKEEKKFTLVAIPEARRKA